MPNNAESAMIIVEVLIQNVYLLDANVLGYTEQIAALIQLHYLLCGIHSTQGTLHNQLCQIADRIQQVIMLEYIATFRIIMVC